MKEMTLRRFGNRLPLLLVGLALAACGSSGASTAEDITDPALTDNTWQLTALNGVQAAAESPAILAFGEENNMFGSTGCNLFTGSYLLEEQGSIRLQPTVTSAIECPAVLQLQDQAMVMVLSTASSYVIEEDALQVSNPDASQQAAFVKVPPLPISGTSWVLNAYNDGQGAIVAPLEGTQVTADFAADGNLAGTAGCNTYTASYEATEKTLQIGAPATTRMMCSDPEGIMDQETNYLGTIQKAVTYRNMGIALILYDQAEQPLVTYVSSALVAGSD